MISSAPCHVPPASPITGRCRPKPPPPPHQTKHTISHTPPPRGEREALEEDPEDGAGPRRGRTSSEFSGEALYLRLRAARPSVVVETGVLEGASSAQNLAAMARTGSGELPSNALGCPPGEPSHDFLVPPDLASRWTYIRGSVREELPPLLARLGTIDMFNHDSLHTFENMTWEYETAFGHLRPGGVLSSHDVMLVHSLGRLFGPNAFPAFCRRRGLGWTTFGNSGFTVMPVGTDGQRGSGTTGASNRGGIPTSAR